MEIEILKMLPGGGSVVALIIVVILFLKQQEKTNDTLQKIADKFSGEVRDAQGRFQAQIQSMSNQWFAAQQNYQEQVRSIIDEHVVVTKETVKAVQSLDSTVKGVEQTVQDLQAVVESILEQRPEPPK